MNDIQTTVNLSAMALTPSTTYTLTDGKYILVNGEPTGWFITQGKHRYELHGPDGEHHELKRNIADSFDYACKLLETPNLYDS